MIQTASNRIQNLVASDSAIIAISVSVDDVLVGCVDGSVIVATIGSREGGKVIATCSSPAYAVALASTGHACFGGSDGRLVFLQTHLTNQFDGPQSSLNQSLNQSLKRQTIELDDEILALAFSPSGNILIASILDKVTVFELDGKIWKQSQVVQLEGAYLLTSLFWSRDGAKVIIGTINGAIELFTFKWKRKKIGGRFNVDFIGTNQVNISGERISASFSSSSDTKDVKLVKEYFVVIWTQSSLIVADLREPEKCSQVNWTGMTKNGVKFSFEYQNIVLINVVGELYILELGCNEFLSSVRTDFVNPLLISVRICERKSDSKVLAYLLDIRTICVMDLVSSSQVCSWSHERRIDWIELNETGEKLLFRDKSFRLHLLDVERQEIRVMLNLCGFVQWVPGSDVIVAQNREKLYIWYDLNKPVVHEIEGGSRVEATGIEREGGLTRVTLTGSKNDIILDETFLEFDTSLQDGDLER